MTTRLRAALVPVAAGVALTACSGDESRDATSATAASTRSAEVKRRTAPRTECPRVRPKWARGLPPARFFPPARAALWLRHPCLYLVHPTREEARPLWRARGRQRVLRLSWAPDGETFALTTEARIVLVLRRDGSLVRRVGASGAAFLQDGRLVVSRPDGIHLLGGVDERRLASRSDLEQAAGFRARRDFSVGHDPRGFTRGSGRGAVAFTLWSAGRSWKSVVLVVTAEGRVVRASPAYRAGGGEGAVYGWAWSPGGRELLVAAETAASPERSRLGKHDHCVDSWSEDRGRRRLFCESQLPSAHQTHFAKLVWDVGGKTVLLDNGTIVGRDGRLVGRAPLSSSSLSFQLQWEPAGR